MKAPGSMVTVYLSPGIKSGDGWITTVAPMMWTDVVLAELIKIEDGVYRGVKVMPTVPSPEACTGSSKVNVSAEVTCTSGDPLAGTRRVSCGPVWSKGRVVVVVVVEVVVKVVVVVIVIVVDVVEVVVVLVVRVVVVGVVV